MSRDRRNGPEFKKKRKRIRDEIKVMSSPDDKYVQTNRIFQNVHNFQCVTKPLTLKYRKFK